MFSLTMIKNLLKHCYYTKTANASKEFVRLIGSYNVRSVLGYSKLEIKMPMETCLSLVSCRLLHSPITSNVDNILTGQPFVKKCVNQLDADLDNRPTNLCEQKRHKSTKKSNKRPEYDSDSDSDVDEDTTQGGKLSTVRTQSLRLDAILKKALNLARNKIETAFYQGNIRINGKKPFKKSSQLQIGDEVDLIRGVSPLNPEFLSVSRVELLSVKEEGDEGNEDELAVRVRVSKAMYIENYPTDPWKKGTSAE